MNIYLNVMTRAELRRLRATQLATFCPIPWGGLKIGSVNNGLPIATDQVWLGGVLANCQAQTASAKLRRTSPEYEWQTSSWFHKKFISSALRSQFIHTSNHIPELPIAKAQISKDKKSMIHEKRRQQMQMQVVTYETKLREETKIRLTLGIGTGFDETCGGQRIAGY
ncbi:hypothetical protein BJX63DRAFT_100892 [Aspergillus granulosus]|uniref:Uncharacterized protein n=1 Tax=Aspergillus granulosus TaxID=176169 RepID=A0ABR4GUE0_9EURO